MQHNEEHNYTFLIPSNKPDKVQVLRDSLPMIDMVHFDGTGQRTWSNMWNAAVSSTETDLIVLCQDKALPTLSDVERGLDLFNQGFGSVQMHCMGFVVFHKSLLDQIGWMEERCGGGGAHCDFMIRHKEGDIAYYESIEVEYEQSPSAWRTHIKFLYNKWHTPSRTKRIDFEQRLLPDQDLPYVTNAAHKDFLKYEESVILTGNKELFNRRFVR